MLDIMFIVLFFKFVVKFVEDVIFSKLVLNKLFISGVVVIVFERFLVEIICVDDEMMFVDGKFV